MDLSQDGITTDDGTGTELTTVQAVDADTTGTDPELDAGLNIVTDVLDVDLSEASDVAEALAADYTVEDNAVVYAMFTDGSDTVLYAIDDTAGTTTGEIDEDDLTLVATFEDVSDMSALAGSSTSFVDFV